MFTVQKFERHRGTTTYQDFFTKENAYYAFKIAKEELKHIEPLFDTTLSLYDDDGNIVKQENFSGKYVAVSQDALTDIIERVEAWSRLCDKQKNKTIPFDSFTLGELVCDLKKSMR